MRLAERGFDTEAIAQAIRTASPRLEERKRGHVEDYVRRTVEAAVREGERERREREEEREW
jgi:hypothetical protein